MDTLSAAGVVEEFLERWRSSDLPDKMPEPMLTDNEGVVELTLIAVKGPHQNKGYGTRALQMLTALCDENGVTITLVARQMDPDALSSYAPGCPARLSTEQLVGWYKRHRFVEIPRTPGDDTRTMIREPQDLAPKKG